MREKKYAETPLMKQFYEIKAVHPEAILLFRVGDFYETFGEDAIFTSKVLNIILTKRSNGSATSVELAGFPYHSLDTYLHKLVRAGAKVAICEQLEDPKLTKKIVKRGVTELITPGISFHEKVLENTKNNFLCALHWQAGRFGIAFLDVSTGDFFISEGSQSYVEKLLQSFLPKEVVILRENRANFLGIFGDNFYLTTFDDWVFKLDFGRDLLLTHFQTHSLKGFGIEENSSPLPVIAAGAALHYAMSTQIDKIRHICKLKFLVETSYVWLDRFTIRNLELVEGTAENNKTLFSVLDKSTTNMGARLLRRWLVMPLTSIVDINSRLDKVEFLSNYSDIRENLIENLDKIGDLERLVSKISIKKAHPKEVIKLKTSLLAIKDLKDIDFSDSPLYDFISNLNFLEELVSRIDQILVEDPSSVIGKGDVINVGVNEELDDLKNLSKNGKKFLVEVQQREIEKTGINSLKLGFNNVIGYYLEVTHAHKDKVPADWIRKQTLTNGERFITEEIKSYEAKILNAEERIFTLESQIFGELLEYLMNFLSTLQDNAQILAELDVLLSFALVALENKYVKPTVSDSLVIDIKQGRHPVIEKHLKIGENYIPNNLFLDNESTQIMMITGPNMSGKSAVLRQTALIVLMAQVGCFVPAELANIGLVDKIFTRVGASDNLSSGESTFMVEMNETASILNNISSRSLILLDEIGRGTSTYDGISIAWSIAEYLHENPTCACKVLFATHYHELNEMSKLFPRIKNFHVKIKESNDKILFLRTLEEGGSEHSFGIHVARMAGMPIEVVERAQEVMRGLEGMANRDGVAELGRVVGSSDADGGSTAVKAMSVTVADGSVVSKGMSEDSVAADFKTSGDSEIFDAKSSAVSVNKPDYQLSFIQLDDPLLLDIKDELLETNINDLTPLEALNKLNKLKKMLG